MPISTVALSDTFDQWRIRFNEVVSVVNAQLDASVLSGLDTTATSTLVAAINELVASKADLATPTFTGATTFEDDITSETIVFLADGAVGAPALSFTSDTDTGLYWASSTLHMAVGGASIIALTATGVTINQDLTFGAAVDDINLPTGCEINLAGNFAIKNASAATIIDHAGVGAAMVGNAAVVDYSIKYTKLHGVQAANQTDVSGARTINYNDGDWHKIKVNGNATLSITNLPTNKLAFIVLEAEDFGAHTITWPTGIKWSGAGTAPTMTEDGIDLVCFFQDGSGNLYGALVDNEFA